MHLRNVTLEMSLKPFRQLDEPFVRQTCRWLFTSWLPLLRQADGASVMLWTADGSEILDYRGDPEGPLEWARYIGGANPPPTPIANDPECKALHSRHYLYMDNPPEVRYRDLATVVRCLREEGQAVTGKPVRVGATFDPGPEFARSSFKYERHPEICLAGTMGSNQHRFVTCFTTLKGDTVRYAGFPTGIPDGTPLGTFLGRQSRLFLRDMGFDYLWFSNGFGFGMETWRTTGALFDGTAFRPERATELADAIVHFWELFRAECPDVPLETRGTNLTTGVDLASDACPLARLYAGGFGMMPPPNSPWAALDGDFGLELVGYMSHIAELPDEQTGFPFRYYTHDPWWLNSPWLDRYGREAHDIYLPLAVSRVDPDGEVRNPVSLNLLTADDSYGRMPEKVPNEVIPHLLEAQEHAPDRPGPLVWVYPFAEYHELTFGSEPRLDEVFYGDWFMRGSVNHGLPANTVVSSRVAADTLARRPGIWRESVLVTPVPDARAGAALATALSGWIRTGGRVLFYGPVASASPELRDLLGVDLAEPVSGTLQLDLPAGLDIVAAGAYPTQVNHRPLLCAGGCEAVARQGVTEVLATVRDERGQTRVAALTRAAPDWHGGRLVWVRGTSSNSCPPNAHLLRPDDPREWFHGEMLMRIGLARFGLEFVAEKHSPDQREPVVCVARHRNGFFFSGYTPNTTVGLHLRLPAGAPLLLGFETRLVNGRATYRMPRAWHRECRVFVEQVADTELACVEVHSGEIGVDRRFRVSGLQDAVLRFYPVPGRDASTRALRNPAYPYQQGEWLALTPEDGAHGHCLRIGPVSGTVLVSW